MASDDISIHSAARLTDLEAAELLLKEKGVDIYGKDENGRTPLHILMQKRIELFDYMRRGWGNRISSDIIKNEKFIEMLLKHSSPDPNCTSEMRLLNFHAACTLDNFATAESHLEKITDVNQSISEDSPMWPGYTALHFAVHCNIELAKMLIAKGANLLKCDAKGLRPLKLCIQSLKLEELQSILICVTAWKDILFSDGKTKLMDYISVLHDPEKHKQFVQSMAKDIGACLPKDSPLWPGQTILHLAMTLLRESKRDMIKDILNQGADVTIQDIHGSTPIHLAFYRNELNFLGYLNVVLEYHKKVLNALNKSNLSHLHIACTVNNIKLVKKLLTLEADINIAYKGRPLPNIKPGWTPLHVACFTDHSVLAKMLLEAGANLLQTDAEGFTAIHRLMGTNGNKHLVLDALAASEQLKDCIVEGIGLTHLHVMAFWKKPEGVKRLLDSGADIEAIIGDTKGKRNLCYYEGHRPLHLAMRNMHPETVKVLVERGADIFAKNRYRDFPLREALTCKYNESLIEPFISLLWTKRRVQKRIEKEMGLTLLHIVCYALDLEKIKNLLKAKVDVNARTREDSPIWPGFTALHVLTDLGVKLAHSKGIKGKVDKALKLLLAKKADVTLTNADGDTPVHSTLECRFKDQGRIRASLLLKYHRNFKVNPTNKKGWSHFHIACLLCNVTAVRGFLKCGADVNQVVNESSDRFSGVKIEAGMSPLHLALNTRARPLFGTKLQLQTVDALLEHGANVDAVDSRGWTPLHCVAECSPPRQKILKKIVSIASDTNKVAVKGETPLEILLHHGASLDEVKMFVEHGSRLNGYNPITNRGYMTMVITNKNKDMAEILILMLNLPDIAKVDERGRNAIFNMFDERQWLENPNLYVVLIEGLIKLGCEINQQDREGKTPLHVAVESHDHEAIGALLVCGADINLVDSVGESPFSYCVEQDCNYCLAGILINHVKKLRVVGLEVSELNVRLLTEVRYRSEIDEMALRDQMEKTNELEIGRRGLTLYDFIFEKDVAKLISMFTSEERTIVGCVLELINYETFDRLGDLLKLQYMKVLERLPLLTPAATSLNSLIEFPLPDLCVENIIKFLTNAELKSLVSANIEDNDLKMDVD